MAIEDVITGDAGTDAPDAPPVDIAAITAAVRGESPSAGSGWGPSDAAGREPSWAHEAEMAMPQPQRPVGLVLPFLGEPWAEPVLEARAAQAAIVDALYALDGEREADEAQLSAAHRRRNEALEQAARGEDVKPVPVPDASKWAWRAEVRTKRGRKLVSQLSASGRRVDAATDAVLGAPELLAGLVARAERDTAAARQILPEARDAEQRANASVMALFDVLNATRDGQVVDFTVARLTEVLGSVAVASWVNYGKAASAWEVLINRPATPEALAILADPQEAPAHKGIYTLNGFRR